MFRKSLNKCRLISTPNLKWQRSNSITRLKRSYLIFSSPFIRRHYNLLSTSSLHSKIFPIFIGTSRGLRILGAISRVRK